MDCDQITKILANRRAVNNSRVSAGNYPRDLFTGSPTFNFDGADDTTWRTYKTPRTKECQFPRSDSFVFGGSQHG